MSMDKSYFLELVRLYKKLDETDRKFRYLCKSSFLSVMEEEMNHVLELVRMSIGRKDNEDNCGIEGLLMGVCSGEISEDCVAEGLYKAANKGDLD